MNEERLFEMLSELKVHAATTNERLAHYNASLDDHIKRTNILEKQMEMALMPIKASKFLVKFASGALTLAAFLKLIGKI